MRFPVLHESCARCIGWHTVSNYKFRTTRSIVRGLTAGNLNRQLPLLRSLRRGACKIGYQSSVKKKNHAQRHGEQRRIQRPQLANRANVMRRERTSIIGFPNPLCCRAVKYRTNQRGPPTIPLGNCRTARPRLACTKRNQSFVIISQLHRVELTCN